jgi:hypothetical protein
LPPQPDLLSKGNKRPKPKEDDEMSTSQKDVKRRRSPPFDSHHPYSPDSNETKSRILSSPPLKPPPAHRVGSDIAADSAYTRVNYVQEDNSGQPSPILLRDLETRAITVPQLIQEVKGIYAGLGK